MKNKKPMKAKAQGNIELSLYDLNKDVISQLPAKTEDELKQELPNICDYSYADYYELKVEGVLYLPLYMYYFVFEEDLQIDYSWLDYISDELIIKIPLYLGDLPKEYDYFKVLDLTNGVINHIELYEDSVHTYVLYCYNVDNKKLISIGFEV